MEARHKFEIAGGLGNQLFQLEALKTIAPSSLIDTTLLHPPFMRHGITLPELSSGNFETVHSMVGAAPTIGWKSRNLLNSIGHRVTGLERLGRSYRPRESGYSNEVFDTVRKAKTPLRIRGYFQSYRYFSFRPQGPGCKAFDYPLQSKFSQIVLGLNHDWASIHVRRGDFKDLKNTVGLLGSAYYHEGLKQLSSLADTGVVFSDSVEEAKDLFGEIPTPLKLIFAPNLGALETLSLMTKAKANLIANSTFSYWGAARNPNAQMILYPREWFKSAPVPRDLVPQHWEPTPAHFL